MRVTLSPAELTAYAESLLGGGFRLALVAGHDDRDLGRAGPRVVYLFTAADRDRRVELHVPLDPARPHVPSLAGISFAAGRFERELHDLFGIVPDDHPLPRRLVRHFHWPRGWHPMLTDAGDPPEFGDTDGPYPFRAVEGPGVYEIPVGPVHAGMIGPGHFRFSVVGETILNLRARLWFVHRGVEKLFAGRAPDGGVELAERVSGDTSVGHSLAYCLAVEQAAGIPVSAQAQRMRAILLELERLYNHVADLGALCNDVGHGILNVHAGRIREDLLRINDQVTGSRLLRGVVRPGATAVRTLPDQRRLTAIGADVAELARLALEHTVVRDRFAGTAVLTREQAADLGTLGYVARASGLTVDARHDHPFLPDDRTRTRHTHTDGDVLSRFVVRVEEIAAAIARIAALADTTDTSTDPAVAPTGRGIGIVEGWRGTIVHRVETTEDGVLTRVKIVDPSFFNWPALPVALADTIVPDFPLTNKSFNLSYAGNDL
ncbi:hydrogenase large subunit [Actinophytocola sediminis]